MNTCLLFVHALSPLHSGTGQGVGVIDLPVAREKATGLPYLPGSSVKGVLRDACENGLKAKIFGPEGEHASDHAGTAQFSDQRLLLLPVRSLYGTFAWVTAPYVLSRFARDVAYTSLSPCPASPSDMEVKDELCLVGEADCALHKTDGKAYFEDLDLQASPSKAVTEWAQWLGKYIFPDDPTWQKHLAGRLCIVSNDVLSFLLETATEVTARIRLEDDSKTVAQGALWYEEALPTETVLYGLVVATPVQKADIEAAKIFYAIQKLAENPQQFGGKATVGRGLCKLNLVSA